MAKGGVHPLDALAISGRLKRFVAARYPSWEAFCDRLGVPRSTADAWRREKDPSVPDATGLVTLAEKANLDLTWLLTGNGTELWKPRESDAGRRMLNAIEAELRNSEDVTAAEFAAAWDRLLFRGDFSQGEDVIFKLAVEGVRPRFLENVRLVRHYAGVMTVLNQFVPTMLAESGPDGAKLVERWKRELHEALLVDISPHQPLAPKRNGR